MTYLHKNKIKIRYSNNDLVFKHNNITYKGYYMETSKGRLYSGTIHMRKGAELIINPYKGSRTKTFGQTKLARRFNHVKRDVFQDLKSYTPLPISRNAPIIDDYKRGYYYRYFAKRINGNQCVEISESVYNSLKSKDGTFDDNLYYASFIAWHIKGIQALQKNTYEVRRASRKFPGLINLFPILNEFHKPPSYVLENQYTNGGELYYGDGTEYIGEYHIHPSQGPMVGATHDTFPHPKLYYTNQLPQIGDTSYEDFLDNYNKIECFKCILINDQLNMVSTQRSRLLGCYSDSYISETEALDNCPRTDTTTITTPTDEYSDIPWMRPDEVLEGGNPWVYVNDAIGDINDTDYSNFDIIGDSNTGDANGNGNSSGNSSNSGYGGSNTSNNSGGGGSHNYGPSCFTPNTLITMADGTEKPISDIEVGDKVKSEIGESNVLNIQIHEGEFSIYSFNGNEPFVTIEHPFKSIDGWKAINPITTIEKHQVPSSTLNIHDVLIKLKGQEIIETIEEGKTKHPKVYNLSLDNEHVYYANGYLVHNLKTVDLDDIVLEDVDTYRANDWIGT